MKKFNEIQSRNDFADLLKIPLSSLTYLLYVLKPDNCYNVFSIPKRSGGEREISAPNKRLKSVQTAVAMELWRYIKNIPDFNRSAVSHAFTKKKGIITNAAIHRNKRIVVSFDLNDFFPSIHFGRVVGFFEKNRHFKLPHAVSLIIAQIACHNGSLPQGSPCSPIISNLICQILDYRILRLAKKYKLDYTRYADDLTFSTNWKGFVDAETCFYSDLSVLISKAGFTINEAKTRTVFRNSRQTVTGIVVNKKLNINREYYKETKAMAHNLYSKGSFVINGKEGTINQLEGRFAFIDQIELYNNRIDGNRHNYRNLCGRELEYRKFLFYKYFYAADKPTLITEGKSDELYIKAALRKMFLMYPSLINKKADGRFEYKVRFLKRSKRLQYFFGFSPTGADAMTELRKCFIDESNSTSLFSFFNRICASGQIHPVIFIFDNETERDKPLKKFLNQKPATSEVDKEFLQNNLYLNIIKDSKLFVITNKLVSGKSEAEIEDLFSENTLSTEIGGKSFCRKDNFDESKFYGKAFFSKYIYKNYESIDFSNFIPMLDALNNIITTY